MFVPGLDIKQNQMSWLIVIPHVGIFILCRCIPKYITLQCNCAVHPILFWITNESHLGISGIAKTHGSKKIPNDSQSCSKGEEDRESHPNLCFCQAVNPMGLGH